MKSRPFVECNRCRGKFDYGDTAWIEAERPGDRLIDLVARLCRDCYAAFVEQNKDLYSEEETEVLA